MAQAARKPAASSSLQKLRDRIKDIELEVVEKEATLLAYGDKGTGKTTALQGLAQKLKGEGRILRLDSSDGWISLENIPQLKADTDNLEYVTLADLGLISDALLTRKPGFEGYTVVVLDEVSPWYIDALHAYVREQMNLPAEATLPAFGWDYYGVPQAALLEVFKKMQRTPGLHVLMAAHEQERAIKGENNAKRMVPAMGTKLTEGLGQISHVVARFESRSVQGNYVREVQSWPTRLVDAKSRIKQLELKMPSTAWVKAVASWVEDSATQAEDLAEPEESVLLPDDTADDETFEVPDEE